MRSLSLIVARGRLVTSTSSFRFGAISLSQMFKMADTAKSSRESNSLSQIAVNSQCIRPDRDVTELEFHVRDIEG